MYEERVLVYMDILGFTNAVKKTIECKETENFLEIQRIDNFLGEVRFSLSIKDLFPNESPIKDRVTSQFSDSVVVSYSADNYFHHVLQDAYFLSVMALKKGFLLRGAIVYGKVIHSEEGKKLFGPAFLKAYDLERKEAKFPRIIIDESFLDKAKESYSKCPNSDDEYCGLEKMITYDFDGKPFVNYIDKLYTGVNVGIKGEREHLMCLNDSVKKLEDAMEEDAGIKCKYLWLKEKYDEVCKKHGCTP